MPVFISHRTIDDSIAKKIYDRLSGYPHYIQCYLDDFDDEAKNTSQITKVILDRIESCTHLVAVVTANTKGSWWVPFEIGVARRAPRVISSFTSLYSWELPDYLKEWPILKGQDAIDVFARFYKEGKKLVETQYYSFTKQISEVDSVHKKLKSALGQF